MEKKEKIISVVKNRLYLLMSGAPLMLWVAIIREFSFFADKSRSDWQFGQVHLFFILVVALFLLGSFWAWKVRHRLRLGIQLIIGTSVLVFFQIFALLFFVLFYPSNFSSPPFEFLFWVTFSPMTLIIIVLVAIPGIFLSLIQWKEKEIKFSGLLLQWMVLLFPLTQIIGMLGIMFNEGMIPDRKKIPVKNPSLVISLIVVKIFLSIGVTFLFFRSLDTFSFYDKLEILQSSLFLDILSVVFSILILFSHFILFFFMVFINVRLQMRGGIPVGETILRIIAELFFFLQIVAEIGLLIRFCSEVERAAPVLPSLSVPSEGIHIAKKQN